MADIWVKPGDGLIVRDPRTQQLVPAEGIAVDACDLDFVRMLEAGDVVLAERPAAPAEAPPAPPAPKAPVKETDA